VPLLRTVVRFHGLTQDHALFVTAVAPASPAHAAGLSAGDYIIACAGEQVLSQDDLFRVLTRHPAATPLQLSVLRGATRVELTVVPTQR
jgi:S1-C subfamily serine protease